MNKISKFLFLGLDSSLISLSMPAQWSEVAGNRSFSEPFCYRLVTECSLHINETLDFHDAEIDTDGILVLNLRTAKISNRAINHPMRRGNREQ